MNKQKLTTAALAAIMLIVTSVKLTAQVTEPGQTAVSGTFYSSQHPEWPPLPGNPLSIPFYQIGDDKYLLQDDAFDYAQLQPAVSLSEASPPMPGGDGDGTGGDAGGGGQPFARFGSNDLWLSIEIDTNSPGYVDVTAHNTHTNTYLLLQSTTNLLDTQSWTTIYSLTPPDEGDLIFSPIFADAPATFFRALEGVAYISLAAGGDAIEPSPTGWFPGTASYFDFAIVNPLVPITNLTVLYRITGTASNGHDYVTISGSIEITNGAYADVTIDPLNGGRLDFGHAVTLTLIATNGYVPYPGNASASLTIQNDPFMPVVATEGPVALDAYTNSDWLVLSGNYYDNNGGNPTNNFARIGTNGIITQWSSIAGLTDEVKMVTVKVTTNGFTAGDLYFSVDQPGTIGWLSADGARWTTNWATLVDGTNVESDPIRGSLCFDATGIWGHDLIAVTGKGRAYEDGSARSIWRITASGTAHLVTRIETSGLEGALVLPDNPVYGPWAGKLITSDEFSDAIYAVDTNGVATIFDTYGFIGGPIAASDLDLVQTNQSLYCTCWMPYTSDLILNIPEAFMTNNAGEVMITASGETTPQPDGKLFFLHWDSLQTNFVAKRISLPPGTYNIFEHSSFAPIDLPPLAP